MATPDQCRAFARECMQWAEKAKDIKRRDILLDMAACWAQTAAQIEYHHSLLDEFNNFIVQAKLPLSLPR